MITFLYRLGVQQLPFLGLFVAFSCLTLPMTAAEANAELAAGRGLFVEVPAPDFAVNIAASVSRRRVITVDIAALRAQKSVQARLPFNLFADAAYEGVVEEITERGKDDFTLKGSLTGQPLSSFILSAKDGVTLMNLRLHDRGMFQLRYLGNSFYDVRQIDETKYPPCAIEPKHAISAPPQDATSAPKGAAAGDPPADSGTRIDVLVVYTPAARTAVGGTLAMQALINLAIDESNTAYQQSQITPRLRLVHQAEVAYTESASFSTDLSRIATPGDSFMDNVHGLRNQYGADMVSLIINNSASCGIGYLMTTLSPAFESSAFSVAHYDCATGYYSFSHELGHNMGCHHDVANSGGQQGLYPYSYGWRFDGDQYRTIMAYDPGVRVQRFSNPNVNYAGFPTGVATNQPNAAHNALSINNAALTVANWRQEVTTNCTYSLSSYNTNIISAPTTGSFAINASSNICAWIATNQTLGWFSIVGATNGTGNGVINWSATTNSGTQARTGIVVVAAQTYVVVQGAFSTVIPLPVALDVPGTTWSINGNANWFGTNGPTHDTVDAAQSGDIGDNGITYLESVIDGPGTLGFWWKVSSELGWDFLRVSLNGSFVTEISGEVNWTYVTIPLTTGSHTVRWTYAKDSTVSNGSDAGWVDQIQMPRKDFRIMSLTNNATILEHNALTGDDRGGLAASSTHVLYSGDSATAGFSLTDLSGGATLGVIHDGLVSDLQTETMYLLASNNTPVSGFSFSGTVNRLLELTSTGTLSGQFINLSQSIPLNGARGNAQPGVFSGYGQIVLHNRTNVFSIALPSGLVNELGPLADPVHVLSDNWAYWGVAEYFSNSVYLAYVRNSTGIYRMRVQDGTTNAVATFANLGDMANFTVSVPRSRWYFHHEAASQFGGTVETIGYAGARFASVPSGHFVVGSTIWSNNAMLVEFRGPPLTTAVVEYSSNMTAWTALHTNVINTNGVLRYTNSSPGGPFRFYRARVP